MNCPHLTAPAHAYFVNGGGDSCPSTRLGNRSSTLAVPKEACGLRCETGFRLSGKGDALRMCTDSGRWSGREPRCYTYYCTVVCIRAYSRRALYRTV